MFRYLLLSAAASLLGLAVVTPLVAQKYYGNGDGGLIQPSRPGFGQPPGRNRHQNAANRADQLGRQHQNDFFQQSIRRASDSINDWAKNNDRRNNNSRRQQPNRQSSNDSHREPTYQNNRNSNSNYNNNNRRYYSNDGNRNYSNRSQPTRPSYQYSQPSVPSVSTPVVINTVPAVPKNTLPKQQESSALLLTAYENSLPNQQIQDLPAERIDPITGQLNAQLRQELDHFNDSADNATAEMVDTEIDNKVAKGDIPHELGEDLKAAIKEKDFATAKELIAGAGLDGKGLLESMYVIDYYEDLADMQVSLEAGLRDGYTAEQLQPIVDGYQRHLDEGGWLSGAAAPYPTLPSIPPMLDALDSLQQGLAIEDSLYAGPPTTTPDWQLLGTDPLLVIYDPGMAPGDFFRGGPNLLVAASRDGQFHTDQLPFAEAMQLPIGVAGLAPTATATEVDAKSRLLFQNPKSNQRAISFQLQSKNYTLTPGQEETVQVSGGTVVRFDNGKAKTIAYTVKPGTYIFRLEAAGWNTYRSKFKRRIDNTNGLETFHCLVENQVKSIEPGASLELESAYPVVVKFDPGDSAEAVSRLLEKNDYTVAINRKSNSWDLFATVEIAGEAPLELIAKDSEKRAGNRSAPSRKPRW